MSKKRGSHHKVGPRSTFIETTHGDNHRAAVIENARVARIQSSAARTTLTLIATTPFLGKTPVTDERPAGPSAIVTEPGSALDRLVNTPALGIAL